MTPRVGIAFLAYNQAALVRRAAESCFAQQCEPLEIVLSDDCSTDGTFEILQELAANYRGPHLVVARRNEVNVGIGEHYNRVVDAMSAELLVTAAGDDWSVPTRVQRLIEAWDRSGGQVDLIASHVTDLDHDGKLHDVMRVDDLAQWKTVADWARKRPYIIGAGHAFTRRMMKRFGPMDTGVFYEDQVMVFRAIASGGAVTVDEALVHYLRGGTSRKPSFESAERMNAWSYRQRGRELAEMEQLIADAKKVGCEPLVRTGLDKYLRRHYYQQALHDAKTREERLQVFRSRQSLPWWWSFRKLLHVSFPELTFRVKRSLSRLHNKRL